MFLNVILRLAGAALLGTGGWQAGESVGNAVGSPGFVPWGLVGVITGVVVGGIFTPYLTVAPVRGVLKVSQRVSTSRIIAGSLGLVTGLVVAALIAVPVARIPGWPGLWVPVILSFLFASAGVFVMVSREQDLLQFLPQSTRVSQPARRGSRQIVVDTSAIIDGRIADISQTGFVDGALIVPRFILDELRHIADSSDSLRRNRGRRGLEMLNKLRKESATLVQVLDIDRWNGMEVDDKLVGLAKYLGAPIVTTDFNLNRVAQIQGVHVLNINELANALKSVVLPGEELQVRVLQEGKEANQGIGFLDDGTMVVVEGGRRHLDELMDVTVTRVLQTAAGRLIFAQHKAR